MVANLIKVKVDPKDLKSIPDILPYRDLLQGEPVELELTKKEILRCMNFGDVYDLTSGEEVLIDEVTFHDIVEYVEESESEEGGSDDNGSEGGDPEGGDPEVNPDEGTTEEEPV